MYIYFSRLSTVAMLMFGLSACVPQPPAPAPEASESAPITLPDVQDMQLALRAHVRKQGHLFRYTLANRERRSSAHYITSWTLYPHAPFIVVHTPKGWDYETDYTTYIAWSNADADPPYTHDIAPGKTLGGFVIKSVKGGVQPRPFTIGVWDHDDDTGGPPYQAMIQAPYDIALPPESQ